MRNIASKTQKVSNICVQNVQKVVAIIVHNHRPYTQYASGDIYPQKLSPTPSTVAPILHTACTRTFHSQFSKIFPVNRQLSSLSTGLITITTTYILNK